MTDNARMVDLPWVDGTTRTVADWTVYQAVSGTLLAARDGGYSDGIDHPHWHGETECDARVRITGTERFGTIRHGVCTETNEAVDPWHR